MNATLDELCAIEDFGEITARCVVDYFSHEANIELCRRLINAGLLTESTAKALDESFAGLTFVLTGALSRPRPEFERLIAEAGGKATGSVTKKTNYLILGNNDYCKSIRDGKSSKQKKAEKLKLEGFNIEIIPENVFYDMIEY